MENKNRKRKKTKTQSFYTKRNFSRESKVTALAFCVPCQSVIVNNFSKGQLNISVSTFGCQNSCEVRNVSSLNISLSARVTSDFI